MNHTPTPRQKAIANIQRSLLQLSYFDPRIPPVPIDGVWGEATGQAVCAFQRAYGLEVTGEVDLGTWNALLCAYRDSVEENAAPLPLTVFPDFPESGVIAPGEESRTVLIIQFILSELGIGYGMAAGPELTGKYDAATEEAVRRFQTLHQLPPTGRVDQRTWDRLATAQRRTGSL